MPAHCSSSFAEQPSPTYCNRDISLPLHQPQGAEMGWKVGLAFCSWSVLVGRNQLHFLTKFVISLDSRSWGCRENPTLCEKHKCGTYLCQLWQSGSSSLLLPSCICLLPLDLPEELLAIIITPHFLVLLAKSFTEFGCHALPCCFYSHLQQCKVWVKCFTTHLPCYSPRMLSLHCPVHSAMVFLELGYDSPLPCIWCSHTIQDCPRQSWSWLGTGDGPAPFCMFSVTDTHAEWPCNAAVIVFCTCINDHLTWRAREKQTTGYRDHFTCHKNGVICGMKHSCCSSAQTLHNRVWREK